MNGGYGLEKVGMTNSQARTPPTSAPPRRAAGAVPPDYQRLGAPGESVRTRVDPDPPRRAAGVERAFFHKGALDRAFEKMP